MSMNLSDAIAETENALQLCLDNKFELAEQKMAKFADSSIYHALGHGTILFIRAIMSCERADMDRAMVALNNGCFFVSQYRQRKSFTQEVVFRLRGIASLQNLSDEEMHAELCYAELLLARTLLSLIADESLTSVIKGAFRIRACFHSFKDLFHLLDTKEFLLENSFDLKRQFEAGVRSGFGLFNLMLSAMPAKLHLLLQLAGFSGDSNLGIPEIIKSAKMEFTLRSPLAAMILLAHQLFIIYYFGMDSPDFELCSELIQRLVGQYPNGAIILFLLARFRLISGRLDEAIHLYRRSISVQNVYPQFHHICHWELVIVNSLLLHWPRAAFHAKKLLDESRWSKCAIYAYLLAILVDAEENTTSTAKGREAVRLLMKKVPAQRLRIAGKSIPMEKFCERQALKWLARDTAISGHGHVNNIRHLFLPQFEFLYLWNGFSLLERCPCLIRPILAHIDAEWRCWQHQKIGEFIAEEGQLYNFLRAVCLKNMGDLEKASQCFETVIQSDSHLLQTSSAYLLPNACVELALVRMKMGKPEQLTRQLLVKALSYRGYALETKLHFRVHCAQQRLEKEDK